MMRSQITEKRTINSHSLSLPLTHTRSEEKLKRHVFSSMLNDNFAITFDLM